MHHAVPMVYQQLGGGAGGGGAGVGGVGQEGQEWAEQGDMEKVSHLGHVTGWSWPTYLETVQMSTLGCKVGGADT